MIKEKQAPLGILQRRRIEAEVIKPIYQIIKEKFGIETARAIIEEAISQSAFADGQAFAKQEKNGTSMKSFVALQHLWTKDDALDVQITVNNDKQFDYTVTGCRYADMYQEMGLAEIGYLLSCHRDAKFIEGYHANIQLIRPHTIMNGDHFCDFSYRLNSTALNSTANRDKT